MVSGDGGAGNLNRRVGIGEYLDKRSIEQAKLRAMIEGPTSPRLSIRTLILTGFVVDADPFILWFDPARLRRIDFRNDCVDAGFYLPGSMKEKVTVAYPQHAEGHAHAVSARRVEVKEELKVVELKDGKKISEKPHRVKQKRRDTKHKWKGRN